jgi:predicted O-methyltransferase YrrM
MNAIEILEDIFRTETVIDEKGNSYRLNSNLDKEEGNFITKIIRENKPVKTIEVGCAYGISSLYICSAIHGTNDCHHTIIDPFQSTDWKNIGKLNLERAGINYFDIIEEPSEIALPKLLSAGKKYDFGFIDGWHTFDHTLVDFFYLNRLIKVGGIIAIDDVGYPGINKVVRYIMKYPCFELIGNVNIRISKNRELFNLLVKPPFKLISKLLPARFNYELFSSNIIESDMKLRLNSSMVALKKIKEDERPWSWYKNF